jgi:plasmid stabilization system protein ParE
MIGRVIVRGEAKSDLREATAWYRSISPELSNDFVRRVDEAIALARERPLAFQAVYRTFRRILLHRFPYALFYHADEARIVIVAVLHQARDPETLESRQA